MRGDGAAVQYEQSLQDGSTYKMYTYTVQRAINKHTHVVLHVGQLILGCSAANRTSPVKGAMVTSYYGTVVSRLMEPQEETVPVLESG